MGTGLFPGVKGPGRGISHLPPSSVEVKERIELYICSHSGISEPVFDRKNYIKPANTQCGQTVAVL